VPPRFPGGHLQSRVAWQFEVKRNFRLGQTRRIVKTMGETMGATMGATMGKTMGETMGKVAALVK